MPVSCHRAFDQHFLSGAVLPVTPMPRLIRMTVLLIYRPLSLRVLVSATQSRVTVCRGCRLHPVESTPLYLQAEAALTFVTFYWCVETDSRVSALVKDTWHLLKWHYFVYGFVRVFYLFWWNNFKVYGCCFHLFFHYGFVMTFHPVTVNTESINTRYSSVWSVQKTRDRITCDFTILHIILLKPD